MQPRGSVWLWRSMWIFSLLAGLGIVSYYGWLPADGASGDMESFEDDGFRIQWILTVRDNGAGLPQGFSIRTTKTLGLQLVNRLVSQLEGSLELARDQGTTVTITFSEPRNQEGGRR